MNKLKTTKYKPNGDTESHNGLFSKLTKRYSSLSSKIIKRQSPGKKSTSPQKVIAGSYNMTGSHSDDHRLEIGAPVLISTTTIDTDRLDVSEARLKAIGGGIGGTISVLPAVQGQSSSSENEVFVDALSSVQNLNEEEESTFHLAPTYPIPILIKQQSKQSQPPLREYSPQSQNSTTSSDGPIPLSLPNYYDTPKSKRAKSKLTNKRQQSKSAQNLHRSELRVCLQKAPSVELNMSLTTADLENCRDLPSFDNLLDQSNNSDQDADKENSSPSVVMPVQRQSEPNSPDCCSENTNGYLKQKHHFKSVGSLAYTTTKTKTKSVIFSSNTYVNQTDIGSKENIVDGDYLGSIEDFDLKSVSCQSLNAQNGFLSIDELNEINHQINEAEEFNNEIDLEYCAHRDNLKPSERRITLLKNKNSRLISINNNKEKIKKGWSDVKHWLGEESTRIKEVVAKQANIQRGIGGGVEKKFTYPSGKCSPESFYRQAEAQEKTELESMCGSSLFLSQKSTVSPSTEIIANDEREHMELSPIAKRAKLREEREGQNGFEELRRYIKQGGDFGKELAVVLQERVESEHLYSKSLSKMATKLNKACRELPGTIADAWRSVATEMENRSDIHRQLAVSLSDEIVKPLKILVENHHKTRKSVENNVDKSVRALTEWRISEAKAKKSSHTAARENEKLQDAMLDVRIQKSPSIALLHQGPNKMAAEKEIKSAERDCAKLDNKRRKAEDNVKRADVEYYTLCVRAERARVDWEMSVLRGSSLLQTLENQRLSNMKIFVSNYVRLTANMNPILEGLVQQLSPQIEACNVQKDLGVVKNIRRVSEGPSEQLLPDFYCEHTTLAMNRERRKHSLVKLLQLVKTDLERERRSRNGLKGLSQSLNNQEHQNITDKLYHIRSMLMYLEGARFKLHSALLELDHKPRTSHPLAQHIQITRDRTGLQQSILKVPLWLKHTDKINSPDDSFRENDYDNMSNITTTMNGNCSAERKSDVLIKHFDRNFNRSKSNLETISNSGMSVCVSEKINHTTLPTALGSFDRGIADGGSNQPDSDFDEFSSQEDDDDQMSVTRQKDNNNKLAQTLDQTSLTNGIGDNNKKSSSCLDHCGNSNSSDCDQISEASQCNTKTAGTTTTATATNASPSKSTNDDESFVILSRCKALYSYTPKLYDELELSPGDIIEVHAKQEDGWWLGALGNNVGIFPATYVEEFM